MEEHGIPTIVAKRLDASRCHLVKKEVGLGLGHIVLDGDPVGTQRPHSSSSPLFGPCLLWPNGRPSQQLLSSFKVMTVMTFTT